jgi:DNA-binding NarL/FixJ family response regulator
VRVVVADGTDLGREELAALLDRHGVTVLECPATTADLDRVLTLRPPDLALAAADLPPEGGLAGVRAAHPRVPLLVLAADPAPGRARALLEHGPAGLGYLVRPRVRGALELLDAVTRVAAGGSVLDPEVVARLLTPAGGPLARLSDRERDVLALLADGRTNAAIAASLWLTPRTVEGHVRSIFAKLRLPAGPGDHRRVLAARLYLAGEDTC